MAPATTPTTIHDSTNMVRAFLSPRATVAANIARFGYQGKRDYCATGTAVGVAGDSRGIRGAGEGQARLRRGSGVDDDGGPHRRPLEKELGLVGRQVDTAVAHLMAE